MKDYYSVLGISSGADQEEIRRAYRKLARRYHPDVCEEGGDAAARFKEISEAYEVLSNPEKRRNYDLFGSEGGASSVFDRGFDGFSGPFGDIFNVFFGRGQPHTSRSPRRGSDLLTVIELTLDEVYAGIRKEIELSRHETCAECGGSGLEGGYTHDLCPECGGEGRHTRTRRSSLGTFSSSTACRRCGGTGEINTHPCRSCDGAGVTRVVDRLEVDIPPGVDNGDRVRVSGKGEAGSMGGNTGDLYVELRVREHEMFTRYGADLHAAVTVDISEAALGAELDIPTLNGEEKLVIPPGSQPGETFRLRGKGMPRVHSRNMGDLYLTLGVEVPRKLNDEQKKLLREFQRIESRRRETPGIVERLRKVMRPES